MVEEKIAVDSGGRQRGTSLSSIYRLTESHIGLALAEATLTNKLLGYPVS